MKVLVVHNFHRSGSASGDDQVFKHETAMLKNAGIELLRYTIHTDEFDKKNKAGKLLASLDMFWSPKTYRDIQRICKEEKPDIVHVHTFFPLLSPAVFVAAHRSGVKVIQTLHDTRYVCPNASSICNGELCTLCTDGKYFRMVSKKCFKNSKVQSLAAALIFSKSSLFESRIFLSQVGKKIQQCSGTHACKFGERPSTAVCCILWSNRSGKRNLCIMQCMGEAS